MTWWFGVEGFDSGPKCVQIFWGFVWPWKCCGALRAWSVPQYLPPPLPNRNNPLSVLRKWIMFTIFQINYRGNLLTEQHSLCEFLKAVLLWCQCSKEYFILRVCSHRRRSMDSDRHYPDVWSQQTAFCIQERGNILQGQFNISLTQ